MIGQGLAILGCVLGCLGLLEYVGGLPAVEVNARLARALGIDTGGQNMSPHPALLFTLTNLALLLLSSGWVQAVKLVQGAAFLGVMALVGVFLGYAYQEDLLYHLIGTTGMALHSATAFAVLGWGIVLARVEQGLFGVMANHTAGGALARRAMVFVALFPVLLGWVPLLLASDGFSHKTVESVLATVLLIVVVGSVLRLACRLDVQETQYHTAQEHIRQHQAELANVARLNTLGEMASGLAHELNQPLAAISNYAGACLRMSQQGCDVTALSEPLGSIQKQAQRASEIIRRLRAFVRKQQPQKVPVRLDVLIRDALLLIKHQTEQMHVPVLLDVRKGLPNVLVDRIQIEQVILNIVQNGLDAMRNVPSQQRQISVHAFMNPDGFFQVEIRDTGEGMDAALRAKVFDAFVTTKGESGMGIGLALCHSIIDAHGGQLWVESEPGQGATFKFTLPNEPMPSRA